MAIKPNRLLQVGEWQYIPEQDKLMKFDAEGKLSITADLDNLCQKVANYFIVNAGKLVTKDELLLDVWGIRDVSDGRVTRVIRVLRVALGDDTREPRYIETIPKRGYRFIAAVSEIAAVPETVEEQPEPAISLVNAATTPPKSNPLVLSVFAIAALLLMAVTWWLWPADQAETADTDTIPMWRYTPVTALDGLEFYHNVSADERYLVYSYVSPQAESVTVLMLQDLAQHKRVQLTEPSYSSFGASFSPDGTKIAYHRMYPDSGGCEIRVLEFSATDLSVVSDEILVECGEKTVSARVSWSPDGRYLIYPSMDKGQNQLVLYMLALDSGVPEQLTVPPSSSFGDYAARFSRTGDKVVFLRDAAGSAQIWLLNLANRETNMLMQVQDTYPGNVDWGLDNNSIIYPSGPTSIGRLVLGTLENTLLAYTDNYANEIQVTRSGKIVASVGSFSRMNIKKVANQITNLTAHNEQVFSSNRNESFIDANPITGKPSAVVSRRSGLPQVWLFHQDGRQEQVTFFEKNERFRNIAFSPDGNSLLIQLTNEIWLLKSGVAPQKIAGGTGTVIGAPSWSRDGDKLFYAESNNGRWQVISLLLADLTTKEVFTSEKELYIEAREGDYVVWRDSSNQKFYLQRDSFNAVELPIKLPEQQVMVKLELRKNGIYYSYLTGGMKYQLKFYEFETGQTRVARESMQLGRFSISADERFVYILEYEFGDIDIQQLDPGIEAL